MEICKICGKKQYYVSTNRCNNCKRYFKSNGVERREMPRGYYEDELGNVVSYEQISHSDGKISISRDYILEEGKTTLKGKFPKLADVPKCKYPSRLDCNHGTGYKRCEFMKYIDQKDWKCIA